MPSPRPDRDAAPARGRRRPLDAGAVTGADAVGDAPDTALPATPTTANAPARMVGWESANVPSFPVTSGTSEADAGITDERDLQRASLEQVRGAVGDTDYARTLRDNGADAARADAPRRRATPDDRIVDEIHRRLVAHPWLDSREVEVDADDGVVTLRGRVATRTMRRELEDTCHAVPGVHDVLVHVRLAPPLEGA